jgi:hypothetical protein
MLVIAPKDNLVTTFPSRAAVVIEPSLAAQWRNLFSFDDLASTAENIASSRADQGD